MDHREPDLEAIGVSEPPARRGAEDKPILHLSQKQLAQRLGVSERTIEGWRYRDKGPDYLRLEVRIAYRLADVERYEAASLQKSGAKAGKV
jgi:transcriptional regulator with XRE-family HTH domain